ncbi:hypothetical protein N9042_01400 [bacterium]|nr:hypothetical protein [bacterium]
MKCTILNRNYPPNGGITGHSANELAGYLQAHGVDVKVVTVGVPYGAAGGLSDEVFGSVTSLKTLYKGRQKHLRLLASVMDGLRMAGRAFQVDHGPVICLTDPALLPCWVSRKASKKNRSWFYWSMDLFPEAFMASGLAAETNTVYRWLYRNTRASAPTTLIALGPKQADFIGSSFAPIQQKVILPCGISDGSSRGGDAPEWYRDHSEKVFLGYVGNLGEAHDPDFVIEVMKSIDPLVQRFILVGYGAKADRVCAVGKKLPGVTVLERVEREHLRFIDIHLATLLPEWDHVCVPSKAVSAVCEGGCLLLCCSDQNDNWELLQDASWRVSPHWPGKNHISDLVRSFTSKTVSSKKKRAALVKNDLLHMKDQAFANILEAIQSAC